MICNKCKEDRLELSYLNNNDRYAEHYKDEINKDKWFCRDCFEILNPLHKPNQITSLNFDSEVVKNG